MKLGFLTDLHYREHVAGSSPIVRRESRRVGELLDRCLELLVNERVEAVLCAGDCVDNPDEAGALEDLAALRERFASTGLPTVIVPGNHDPAPGDFYRVMPRPPRVLRVGNGQVFTCYDDVWQPEKDRALRPSESLTALRQTLTSVPGHTGPAETTGTTGTAVTVVLQHYVLFPEHVGPGYDHTLQNGPEVRAILDASATPVLAVSGHNHQGHALQSHQGVWYFTGQSLCEQPYRCYVLEMEPGEDGISTAGSTTMRPTLGGPDAVRIRVAEFAIQPK